MRRYTTLGMPSTAEALLRCGLKLFPINNKRCDLNRKKEKQLFSDNLSNSIETIFRRSTYLLLNFICLFNAILLGPALRKTLSSLLMRHMHTLILIIAITSLATITVLFVYSFFIPPIKTDFPYPRALFISVCIIAYLITIIGLMIPF